MAEEMKVNLGPRRQEDIALDLLKYIVGRQSADDQPRTTADILKLYDQCIAAVRQET